MLQFIRKKKYFCFLFFVLIFLCIFQFAKEKVILFVYNHPLTNATVFKSIAPVIKHFDFILEQTSLYMGNSEKYKISYVYKNYYGSGFLKYNPMPNDLDATIGVNLGIFKYNGDNSQEIANLVLAKISVFYTAFYEAVKNNRSEKLVSGILPFETFDTPVLAGKNEEYFFRIALENAFSKNDRYMLPVYKSPIDNENIRVLIPFVMNKDEILIENMPPSPLYSGIIKYNDTMQNYVRDFSVIFDFFIDVENTQNGEVRRFELVPESFFGERLQFSRRMFVPNSFAGLDSVFYLKSLDFINNDDLYLSNRLYNFERYIFVFEYNLAKELMHVKMLKRLHQAVDAFAPLLSQEEKQDFYSTISSYLNNENLICLNDVVNIFTLMKKITENKNIFLYFRSNGQIERLDSCFANTLLKLKDSNLFELQQVLAMENLFKEVMKKVYSVDSDREFEELQILVRKNRIKLFKITKQMFPVLVDKDKLIYIDEVLKEKFLKAGYKKYKVYWLDTDTIGVVKDSTLKNISESEFNRCAKSSGLPPVEYKYIDAGILNKKIYADTELWIRLNTTAEEDAYFSKIKDNILKDRKNYNTKFKIVW